MSSFPERIFLTGFMAAGKTTVGRLLAAELGYRFVDMDSEIEASSGIPVSDIFRIKGETTFRRAEADMLATMAGRRDIVVSTGGGALARPKTMMLAKSLGLVVFLDVSENILIERLLRNSRRPLIEEHRKRGEGAVDEFVRTTMASRRPIYEQAHIAIRFTTETPQVIVNEIMEGLRQLSLNDRR
jgi:shikimate kinase